MSRPLLDCLVDSRFIAALPADPELTNFTRQVESACYSFVTPTPVAAPKLVAWSQEVASLLEIANPADASGVEAELLAGNRVAEHARPFAACYGGHQFGSWAGQLGDGRAISLGDIQGSDGNAYEIQLKGAGPTPYSRRGDGRAVLRSSIREFVCSEAMFALGVPTTRALSLVETGDEIVRDMFYDGNAQLERGAIVARVAPSFLRFGNYEIFASRNDLDTLRTLVTFTLDNYFSDLQGDFEAKICQMFARVCESTAHLIVEWMRVGFVHGVMNTDNLSILGLTIDYGPYGWLDVYDPKFTPNTTDASTKRYRFGNQPQIGQWNLARLGSALALLCSNTAPLHQSLASYRVSYETQYRAMWGRKIGLTLTPCENGEVPEDEDTALLELLRELLGIHETDYTNFFRCLIDLCEEASEGAVEQPWLSIGSAFYGNPKALEAIRSRWSAFLAAYLARFQADARPASERIAEMRRANPWIIPRNYLVHQAVVAAQQGNYEPLNQLLEALAHPYEPRDEFERYAEKMPRWARNTPGCSALSCSS